jgi:hypothetical protein
MSEHPDIAVDVEVEVEVDGQELEIEVGETQSAEAELEVAGVEIEVEVDIERTGDAARTDGEQGVSDAEAAEVTAETDADDVPVAPADGSDRYVELDDGEAAADEQADVGVEADTDGKADAGVEADADEQADAGEE